jgi:UDP-hydrolysing UDP-N-acetyl-D-glucosamine 2-epimerase
MKRKICVVTGSRADYGVMRWIMEGIRQSDDLQLQIIATGMHLSPEFGLTHREIEKDGLRIDERVEILLFGDTSVGIAKSVARGISECAEAYFRLQPDMVLVIGDRFEILAAVQAAFFAGICISHISGGEVTEGALDDSIRHCITKMSHYHFVAAEDYRKRVIQLGEQPANVFNVGDPGLDNIRRLSLLTRTELDAAIGLPEGKPFFLATYHPVTAGELDPTCGMQSMLDALDEFPEYAIVLTKSNADTGGQILNSMIDSFASTRSQRVIKATSLGQLIYLSAMKHCAAVVGNSSSGIIEAPAMRVPTVNIGTRQLGRLKAGSVLDCTYNRREIVSALSVAVSPEFRMKATEAVSLYGDCDATTRILQLVQQLDVRRHYSKPFYDLPKLRQ